MVPGKVSWLLLKALGSMTYTSVFLLWDQGAGPLAKDGLGR